MEMAGGERLTGFILIYYQMVKALLKYQAISLSSLLKVISRISGLTWSPQKKAKTSDLAISSARPSKCRELFALAPQHEPPWELS